MLLLVDTAGCGFEERQEEEGDSRSNEGEAKVRNVRGGLRGPGERSTPYSTPSTTTHPHLSPHFQVASFLTMDPLVHVYPRR